MECKRLYPSGYCKGVINAIELVKKTRFNNPNKKIYVLGMIVHNSFVTKELESLDIITLDDSIKTKEDWINEINDGIIVFTAHGISDKIKQLVINKNLEYVDATCEDVLKTQELIKQYINDGYDVLYLGKKNHPEANAVLAISNKIHLITNINDLNLNIDNHKLLLTCQTTMSSLELKELIDEAIKRYPYIITKNDICLATSSRQKAIMEVKDCDLLYVVGDIKSNNTNMLKEIALKTIKEVRLISNYKEINDLDLNNAKNICITAGASTPPNLINEVIDYIENYN